MKNPYEGTKVKVVKNNYTRLNPWAVLEEPLGQLFQVYPTKEIALKAVQGYRLKLIEVIE